MKLLSKHLVGGEYRDSLRQDLEHASICRFLVAYVSGDGLSSIGYDRLARVLHNQHSFGVSSLSCSCGFEPLLRLKAHLAHVDGPRLKYFMDPLVQEDDEPFHISLFHSKLVYLYLGATQKSVVYIGSHNWTGRALGPNSTRNAEASVRLEAPFEQDHLTGIGRSLMAEVNHHLLCAWAKPVCVEAIETNRRMFEEWDEKGCRRAPPSPLEVATVILAVRSGTPNVPQLESWLDLEGRGIYMQVLEETEGDLVWQNNERLFVLVWASESALHAAQQPVILRCRVSTNNAGPKSRRRGTNQSPAPLAGFSAVIWDEKRAEAAKRGSTNTSRHQTKTWSGRTMDIYDFDFPTRHSDSSGPDGTIKPYYRFYLEVDQVVLPAIGSLPDRTKFAWT